VWASGLGVSRGEKKGASNVTGKGGSRKAVTSERRIWQGGVERPQERKRGKTPSNKPIDLCRGTQVLCGGKALHPTTYWGETHGGKTAQ